MLVHKISVTVWFAVISLYIVRKLVDKVVVSSKILSVS